MGDLPIKIMIVDDHPALRFGLRGLLETDPIFKVVAEAANGMEALDHAERSKIDIAMIDIGMPDIGGIKLTDKYLGMYPAAKIIIYSMHEEEEYVFQAIEAGASGYVTKTAPASEIKSAIRRVANGQKGFPSIDKFELRLTLRQRQVLWLIGNEKSNDDIAKKLGIGIRAVEGHRHEILQRIRPYLTEERARNPNILAIIAVKYKMRCNYPDGSF